MEGFQSSDSDLPQAGALSTYKGQDYPSNSKTIPPWKSLRYRPSYVGFQASNTDLDESQTALTRCGSRIEVSCFTDLGC
jgi:hypothetical protein